MFNIELTQISLFSIDKRYYLEYNHSKQFEINDLTYHLVRLLKEAKQPKDILIYFSEHYNLDLSLDDLEKVINDNITDKIHNTPLSNFSKYFDRIKLKFIFPNFKILNRIAKHVLFIYKPIFVISLLFFYILSLTLHYNRLFFESINLSSIFFPYLLFILSSYFHELGHAFCYYKYFNKVPKMGFGLYFIFPVFFVDIKDYFKLTKYQKINIDLSGIYFHIIYYLFLNALFIFDNSLIYIVTQKFILLSLVYNLNPLWKSDGYWFLSDLMNVSNLRLKAFNFKYLKDNIGFKSTKYIIIYSLLSLLFIIYILYLFIYINLSNIISVGLIEYVRKLYSNSEYINIVFLILQFLFLFYLFYSLIFSKLLYFSKSKLKKEVQK